MIHYYCFVDVEFGEGLFGGWVDRWLCGEWSLTGVRKVSYGDSCHRFIYMLSGLNLNMKLMMSTCLPIVSLLKYNRPRRYVRVTPIIDVIILNNFY